MSLTVSSLQSNRCLFVSGGKEKYILNDGENTF